MDTRQAMHSTQAKTLDTEALRREVGVVAPEVGVAAGARTAAVEEEHGGSLACLLVVDTQPAADVGVFALGDDVAHDFTALFTKIRSTPLRRKVHGPANGPAQ